MSDDPFELWNQAMSAPIEDEVHEQSNSRVHPLYDMVPGENGEVKITIFPSEMARQSAAVIAGQMKALEDTGVFNHDEAFKIVMQSMSAVVIHHGNHEDDDDDD
jgi:hypothetical protein